MKETHTNPTVCMMKTEHTGMLYRYSFHGQCYNMWLMLSKSCIKISFDVLFSCDNFVKKKVPSRCSEFITVERKRGTVVQWMFDFIRMSAPIVLIGEVVKVGKLRRRFLFSKVCLATTQIKSNLFIIRLYGVTLK